MTIENYVSDLLNEYSIGQQYNHTNIEGIKRKLQVTKEILEFWRIYEIDVMNGSAKEFLESSEVNERRRHSVDLQLLIEDIENEM